MNNEFEFNINIDRASPVPIYLQIYQMIKSQIDSGQLRSGNLLPPERQLAHSLGLNRSTVLSAYRELKKKGLVEARVGHGTTVLPGEAATQQSERSGSPSWRELFRGEQATFRPDAGILQLFQSAGREDVVHLGAGLPAPELLPAKECGTLLAGLLSELGPVSLLHSPAEGLPEFREVLARWMRDRGADTSASEIMVLSGSQQGLDLAARVFLDPGDTVVVEEPSYFGAIRAFRAAGARLIGIPVDQDGMDTDRLAKVLERHRPKFIYTLPTFQNPSGTTMSLEKRRMLLELSSRYHLPVIEDDPYSELRYSGEPIPSLKSLDMSGRVIYLGTMSKVLFPGLRIGWLAAPEQVVNRFCRSKQLLDLHSNTLAQWFFTRFMDQGLYDKHLRHVRQAYARRCEVMQHALQAENVPGMAWSVPEGGFYFWCGLPNSTGRADLMSEAAKVGVSFLPGWLCYGEDPGSTYIRLTFSYAGEQALVSGINRLAGAVRLASGNRSISDTPSTGTCPIV